MKIVVIGATGTIGKAIVEALSAKHEVRGAHRKGTPSIDIQDPASVASFFASIGEVDAVVCAAGGGAWKPLAELTDADFDHSLRYKLMGQVDVIRHALKKLRDGGSITVTTGVLGQSPTAGSAAISMVNAGLEGFVRAAALEAPRSIRVNAVSPPWVSETLAAMGMDPKGGLPASEVAKAYVSSVEGTQSGQTLRPG